MQWFKDMFAMMQDLRAEYTVATMAISLFLDARNLFLYWSSDDRTFAQSGAASPGA